MPKHCTVSWFITLKISPFFFYSQRKLVTSNQNTIYSLEVGDITSMWLFKKYIQSSPHTDFFLNGHIYPIGKKKTKPTTSCLIQKGYYFKFKIKIMNLIFDAVARVWLCCTRENWKLMWTSKATVNVFYHSGSKYLPSVRK